MTLPYSKKIENFGPQWFSAVMGTGAIAISMHLASKQFFTIPFAFPDISCYYYSHVFTFYRTLGY